MDFVVTSDANILDGYIGAFIIIAHIPENRMHVSYIVILVTACSDKGRLVRTLAKRG